MTGSPFGLKAGDIRAGSAVLALALIAAGCSGEPTTVETAGEWGGEGLRLLVTPAGAELEFDCAVGTIDVPLQLRPDGTFELPGTFTLGTGGPVREGYEPTPQPASFVGTVEGDRMRLEGTFGPDVQAIGPYRVEKAAAPILRKCL